MPKQDKTSDWLSQNKKKTGGYQEIVTNFKKIDNNTPTQKSLPQPPADPRYKI